MLLAPSLFEGLGIVLVEAMSKGLPSIASRIEVLEEVAEDNVSGLFVEPNTEDELAAAMVRLFHDPGLRERLGANARRRAEEQFFSEVLMPEWEKIYSRLSPRSDRS